MRAQLRRFEIKKCLRKSVLTLTQVPGEPAPHQDWKCPIGAAVRLCCCGPCRFSCRTCPENVAVVLQRGSENRELLLRAAVNLSHVQLPISSTKEAHFVDDDEASPDLYKASFSLAYGTVTLLRETELHLKKHRFFGLLGATNCDKSALMRAVQAQVCKLLLFHGFDTRPRRPGLGAGQH